MEKTLITSLIEAKAEHEVEIRYINAGLERIFNELKQINTRLAKIENKVYVQREKKHASVRYSFVEAFWEYRHLIAISVALISFILSFFFGFHIGGE